jgi:hypothetical protein
MAQEKGSLHDFSVSVMMCRLALHSGIRKLADSTMSEGSAATRYDPPTFSALQRWFLIPSDVMGFRGIHT